MPLNSRTLALLPMEGIFPSGFVDGRSDDDDFKETKIRKHRSSFLLLRFVELLLRQSFMKQTSIE